MLFRSGADKQISLRRSRWLYVQPPRINWVRQFNASPWTLSLQCVCRHDIESHLCFSHLSMYHSNVDLAFLCVKTCLIFITLDIFFETKLQSQSSMILRMFFTKILDSF